MKECFVMCVLFGIVEIRLTFRLGFMLVTIKDLIGRR